jgi:lipopolysaccharide export system protein LptA
MTRRLFCPAALLPLVLAGVLVAPAALAEKADRDKPMHAEADALRYDDLNRTSVFTGNVVITKGTLVIRGQQVEVREDAEGNQYGTVLASPDKLGYYRQKREGKDEYMEGEARRIEYDGKADVVKFIGQAVMRRYVGTKLNDETMGSLIVYDNTTDIFSVDSGTGSRTASNPSGRVRAMLTPKPKEGSAAPQAGQGPVVLQPSSVVERRP